MSTSDPDAYWRRPADGETAFVAPEPPAEPPRPEYQGPPRTTSPPTGWRTPVVADPVPPRELPKQDLAAIDAAEREARVVTYGVGLVAAAVMLVLLIVVCARVLG